MNKKAIFIDIDGTLFDHETNAIPASSSYALAQANAQGHALFLCTGRPLPDISNDLLALPLDGMILSCGAHVIYQNTCIYEASFPRQDLERLIAYMQKHDIGFALEGSQRNYLSPLTYTLFHGFLATDHKVNSEMARSMMAQTGMHPIHEMKQEDLSQILKISIFSKNRASAHEMLKHLPAHLHGFLYENEQIHVLNGEISIKGVTKATGMDRILSYSQHTLNDTIALGDSLNDLEMLEHAAIGIAMGNAADEVKQYTDYVTDSIQQDGFFHAFQHFSLL